MHKFTSSYSERESEFWIVLRIGKKTSITQFRRIVVVYNGMSKLQVKAKDCWTKQDPREG
jgi:hypothetical protein